MLPHGLGGEAAPCPRLARSRSCFTVLQRHELALNRMNPAHFVAFYVVLPLFVGLLVLQLVLWLAG